ncbi:MAG: DUF4276 family protein [Acidiferrobacter thiooxydans]|nr:DUF4276 family protein [Gammaproteobacteria bacterium]
MGEVVVIAEGQTEEQFIKRLVAPALRPLHVYVKPWVLETSPGHKGGAVTFSRLKLYARNTLLRDSRVVVSTFIDLYALDASFPAFKEASDKSDLYGKLECLEAALQKTIIAEAQCQPHRFIPHIQPHEYEGLLFSDTKALAQTEQAWVKLEKTLADIRNAFETPEHINQGYETAPSRRLKQVLVKTAYQKVSHGLRAAQRIGLVAMEQECPHFHLWMDRLRALAKPE